MTFNTDAVHREFSIVEQCGNALRDRDLRLTRADRKVLYRVVRQKGSEEFFLGGLLGIQLVLFALLAWVLRALGNQLDVPVLHELAGIALFGAVFPLVMQFLRWVLHSFRPIRAWLTSRSDKAQDRAERVLSEISERTAQVTS